MDFGGGNRLELMFNSNLDKATIRAVRDNVVQKPYSKSEIFADDEGAYVVINGTAEGEEIQYVKIYLSNFKRVGGKR